MKSEQRDGMQIDWDAPIEMDDGVVLRADVFRPHRRRPVSGDPELRALCERPRLPGRLQGQLGAPDQGRARGARRLDQQVPGLGAGRSREMGAGRLCLRARRFTRRRPLARHHRHLVAARGAGHLPLHRMGRHAALVERQGRHERHLLLRHQSVAGRRARAAASRRALHLGRLRRLLPRAGAPRRHPLGLHRELVQAPGAARAARRRRATARAAASPASRWRGRRHCRPTSSPRTHVDAAGEVARRRLVDDFYRARMVAFEQIEVPLLSAGNWGGVGLHPRGNFEGYLRAGSQQKWLEVHGDTHFTHFYSNYGMALQKRFFGHFLKGEDTGWERQPQVSLNIRRPGENSRCAANANGRSRARMDQVLPAAGRPRARHRCAGARDDALLSKPPATASPSSRRR